MTTPGPATPPDLTGKTCLITGATSGIGLATAEGLAKRGARVLIVGRDHTRTEGAANRLRESTGNPAVVPLVADLALQAEVRRLANEVLAACPKLDVLVNNAGAMFDTRQETDEGVERTWALNHLAPFLLTNLLLDRLKASAPARVVTVASGAHRMASGIDFDDPEGRRRYRAMHAYAQSKLANILFTRELARRLDGTGVTANALHPGFVSTRFFLDKGRIGWLLQQAARFFAVTPEAGATAPLYLASAPAVANVTGRYFFKEKEARTSRAARDPDAAARLWGLSARATGLD